MLLHKIKSNFSILVISFLFISFGSFSYADEVDILLKPDANIQEIKENFKKQDDGVIFEEIPEIQLLHIKSNRQLTTSTIENHQAVASSGKLADVVLEDDMSKDQLNRIKSSFLPESEQPTSNMNDIEILNTLAWYVDTMTDNQETLTISQGKGIKIGLIDSGVDFSHPVLAPVVQLSQAKSFVDNDSSLHDDNGHGTMVAGMIAQIAPESEITPYKVISKTDGESFWTLEAMIQAVNDGQEILNMSLGAYKSENIEDEKLTIEAFQRAVDYAIQRNVTIISSSGNKGLNLDDYRNETAIKHLPSEIDGVIAVGAVGVDNQLASYSNTGSCIQYVAPGGEYSFIDGVLDASKLIYTTYPLDRDNMLASLGIPQGYMFTIGTSLSAPCVTAVVANYISYYKRMTGSLPSLESINHDLSANVLDLGDIGKDLQFGYGLPQSKELLDDIKDTLPPIGEFQTNSIEVNTEVSADIFVKNLSDNSNGTINVKYFADPNFSNLGVQDISIMIEDASGNYSTLIGQATIQDKTAPSAVTKELEVERGEKIQPEDFLLDITDNYDLNERLRFEFVGNVTTDIVGQHKVNIKITDSSGNQADFSSQLTVKESTNQLADNHSVNNINMKNISHKKLPRTNEKNNPLLFIAGGLILISITIKWSVCR